MIRSIAITATIALLTGCMGSTGTDSAEAVSPLHTALSGKTLANETSTLVLQSDGQMTGSISSGGTIEGSWSIRGEQFCRTLIEPAAMAGSECQDVAIDGTQATFTTSRGERSWTIQ